MSTSDLQDEQAHLERVRAALQAMREKTSTLMSGFAEDFAESRRNRRPGDARPDHSFGFAMALYREDRLYDLVDRDLPLFFGRLWLETGEDYHVGRRHVRDEDGRSVPLVVDWRAPLAERFYRASPHRRLEVDRRRRFGFRGGSLTSLEDEDLRSGAAYDSQLLNAEIERPRRGPMRDIVATIQPEQDELIRRDAQTSVCVQGAPGTGKTAVGLHRAAWLLYNHRDTLPSSGMLVLGPNESFLGYIADVLPILGEASVTQLTVTELLETDDARGADSPDVARLKHDARMAEVCERAVWSHLVSLERHAVIPHGGLVWTVDTELIDAAVLRARGLGRTYGSGRTAFEQAMVAAVLRQAEERTGRAKDSSWTKELRRQPVFKAFIDTVWPRLNSKQVLRRLYNDEAFRTSVCAGLLSADEMRLLHRSGTLKPSAADLVLLDELQSHLGRTAIRRTYGHIVLDEAQDLSPMQCQAIARRCPTGAVTVLGDLAQGTTPWAAQDWDSQMHHLGRPEAEVTEITAGYRVPAPILDLANRLLPHLGVTVPPARSARSHGTIEYRHSAELTEGVLEAVDKALTEEGLVGVIASAPTIRQLRDVLPPSDRVILSPLDLAKGLEFDHVIVVEPAEFLTSDVDPRQGQASDSAAAHTGWRHLYIALTRAVTRLTLVHADPLPPPLGPAT